MSAEPPISLLELDEITGGDREFLRLLTGQFWLDMQERLPELRESVANFDGAKIALLAHTIAGTAGCIAAEELRRRAKQLEECGKTRDVAVSQQRLDSLEEELRRVRKFLDDHLEG